MPKGHQFRSWEDALNTVIVGGNDEGNTLELLVSENGRLQIENNSLCVGGVG